MLVEKNQSATTPKNGGFRDSLGPTREIKIISYRYSGLCFLHQVDLGVELLFLGKGKEYPSVFPSI